MATIKTLAAGVSPYPAAAAEPTVLVTTANGRPSTVAAASAVGTGTTVIVNGQAALNNLITTNQSGVFEGANVVINLEEQNFNTTNQVTATTNYPAGNTGEIQYNSGANSFASDAYFTYVNSNVVTPGIRTNNYLYANGAPFTAGGNAAIGNFVFTGDVMTISDANQVMSITGNGTGNIRLTSNSNIWTFNNVGNLTLPSNTSSINYANGSPYGGGNYSNSNVSGFLAAFGSNVVSTTGNITGGNLTTTGTANVASLAVTGSATVQGSISIFTTSTSLSAAGNIIGSNFIVSGVLVSTNTVSAIGNITGNYFIGNGSQLTGVVSGYGNANVVANLAALGSNPVSTTGNITAATINANLYTAPGNVTVTANAGNTWTFATSGNLVFPSGMIIQNQSPNTRILTNTGRLRITATDNAYVQIGWQSNIADTGPLAKIYANGIDTGQPSNVVIKTGNIAATTYDWVFGNTGNLAAPGRISATNIVTNSIASDDSSFVTIEDGVNITTGSISSQENLSLTANAQTWTFRNDGVGIVLPGGAVIKDTAGNAVAFGLSAGETSQGADAVAIGSGAGYSNQGLQAVAIGGSAGATSQGNYSVAIGAAAGAAGNSAVSIGVSSGFSNQGNFAVAIGASAGATSQANNSIILNATGSALNQTTANTFTVKPVRAVTSVTFAAPTAGSIPAGFSPMYYNPTTGEIIVITT